MLEYNAFKDEIINRIREILGGDLTIEFKTICKVNDEPYEGMVIKTEPEITFPVEAWFMDYYNQYQTIEQIVKRIRSRLQKELSEALNNIRYLSDPNIAKGNIFMKILNYDKNEQWLHFHPYRKYLDLVIVYYIGVIDENGDMHTLNITYDMMQKFELDEEELYSLAAKNCKEKLRPRIWSLAQMFPEIVHKMSTDMDEVTEAGIEALKNMYVLSNSHVILGAVAMLYEGVLEDFAAKIGGNILILPSSIHEVILITDSGMDIKFLQELVRRINRQILEANEVLGENIYVYDKTTREIKIRAA